MTPEGTLLPAGADRRGGDPRAECIRRLRKQSGGQCRRLSGRLVSHRRSGMGRCDGYLTITGRLKEIINRGGEKIAPREVDEVLQSHPAVAQVVTFALPHPEAGRGGGGRGGPEGGRGRRRGRAARASPQRAWPTSRSRGASSFRAEIPKGATGKLQRIGLAGKLGLEA